MSWRVDIIERCLFFEGVALAIIGARLVKIMAAKGTTVASLSRTTGYATSTVSRWRKGAEMTAQQVIDVSEALGVPADYLLYGRCGVAQMLRQLEPNSRRAVERIIKDLHRGQR